MFHIALHFIIPALIAAIFFRKNWKTSYIAIVATMLVDVDHLFTDPIYDPNRCSIGFHFLHGWLPIGCYVFFCFVKKLRYIGIGLVVHMALDWIDCHMTDFLLAAPNNLAQGMTFPFISG